MTFSCFDNDSWMQTKTTAAGANLSSDGLLHFTPFTGRCQPSGAGASCRGWSSTPAAKPRQQTGLSRVPPIARGIVGATEVPELLTGIEPVTSSLPRTRSTD